MKLWLCISLMLWVSTVDAQSIVRGRVQGADGPIVGVVINEITRENRILNSTVTDGSGLYNLSVSSLNNALDVRAKGYTRHIERLLGRTDVDMELTEYISLVDEELLAARHRYYDSYKLFSGRNGQRRVPQLVRVEMLNDTLFTLTVPLWATNLSIPYFAGRTMMFADIMDRPIRMARNVMEVYALQGEPEDVLENREKINYYIGNEFPLWSDHTEGMSGTAIPSYHYPQFLLTFGDIQGLLLREKDLYRVLIETAGRDDYWNLYPEPKFGRELNKIVSKLRRSK